MSRNACPFLFHKSVSEDHKKRICERNTLKNSKQITERTVQTQGEQNMEENKTIVTENENPTVTNEPKEATIDYEVEYLRLIAENKKLKSTADKNASEAADYKKKWKATLDENQQANLAKEEADKAIREELETLRRESSVSKFEKQFLALGYSAEMATKAANAQIDGDMETLLGVQSAFIEQIKKNVTAEKVKNMPVPPMSNDSETSMTQEDFDKLTIREQIDFKNKYPELFKKFTE